MSALPELIRERLALEGLSFRAAADRSAGLVSPPTLNGYAQGKLPRSLSAKKIQGIALAIGVDVGKVREAAGQDPELGRFELPARADGLSQRQRQAVLLMVDALLDADG